MTATTRRKGTPTPWRRTAVAMSVVCLVAAGCGDDDDDAADTPTPVSFPAFDGSIAAEDAELCTIAQAMFDQDDFPSAEQLTKYKELAPDSIDDQVDLAADRLLAAGGDMVAVFNVVAADDVESATGDIDAWEESYCGIPHSESDGLADGATTELDSSAAKVDVKATEFTFVAGTVAAGKTSFVLTNEGKQTHYLGVVKLDDGVELADALASEDGAGVAAEWDSNLAAAGGDTEYLTVDLEPGSYGFVCFLPDTDGTPHAFKGMAVPFTVS
jgi:hypothetical protein